MRDSGDGQRVARLNPDTTATLYIDGEEISVVKGISTAIRYYSQDGTTVAERIQTGSLIWQLNDTQGSAQAWILSGTGFVKRTYYDPYGRVRDLSLPPATDRGFLGSPNDPFTGLDSLDARAYDPDLGRFVSPDPLVDQRTAQGANPYSYAANNPVMYTDATGLISFGGIVSGAWSGVKSGAGFVKGVGQQAWGVPVGLFHAGEDITYANAAYNPLSPLYWLASRNPTYQQQLRDDLSSRYSVFLSPGKLWSSATADIRDDWNNGRKSEAAGRAAFDIITSFIAVTKFAKFARATTATDAAADAASAASDGPPKALPPGKGPATSGPSVPGPATGPQVPWITGQLPAAEESALNNTLSNIDAGTTPTGPTATKWGTKFKHWDGDLPGAKGPNSPYQEYRVAPPPGTSGAGPLRVVRNSQTGATYYTWTHYGDAGPPAFVRIR